MDSVHPWKNDYDILPARIKIINWLQENEIGWEPVGPIAREAGWECYKGKICIDIPFDTSNTIYIKLQEFLEYPDGTIRFPGVRFCYITIESALKNKHHDSLGFWEKWAENF